MTAAAGNVTKLNVTKSNTSMSVVHEGEDGELLDPVQPHIVITEHC